MERTKRTGGVRSRATTVLAVSLVAAALFVAPDPCSSDAAPTGARLVGLERLYFERIAGRVAAHPSVAQSLHAADVRALLPETLPARRYWQTSFPPAANAGMLVVHDLRLPSRSGELVLREVRDATERLTEQWWVLYFQGRRSDAWYFVPAPSRTEGKLLTELGIYGLDEPRAGVLVLHVSGSMMRPAGAWWEVGADLIFSAAANEIRLDRVSERYFASRGYDRGEDDPPIDVRTYAPLGEGGAVSPTDAGYTDKAGPMIEVRSRDAVPDAVLRECAVETGLADKAEDFDPSEPVGESIAGCVTARPGATVERLPAATPSFIERRSTLAH